MRSRSSECGNNPSCQPKTETQSCNVQPCPGIWLNHCIQLLMYVVRSTPSTYLMNNLAFIQLHTLFNFMRKSKSRLNPLSHIELTSQTGVVICILFKYWYLNFDFKVLVL